MSDFGREKIDEEVTHVKTTARAEHFLLYHEPVIKVVSSRLDLIQKGGVYIIPSCASFTISNECDIKKVRESHG